MLPKKSLYLLFIGIAFFSLALGSCTQPGATTTENAEPITLKMALLPILDTLPMYVAQEEGLFQKQGIVVEFISVASAPERDQVIAAGQADGMINETISTAFFNKEETRVQIVRYARTATPDQALFRILAAGKSDISAVEDLKSVDIGISQGTVIEYLTDRLLQSEGFSPDEIKTIAVPKIPDRMALLGTGELQSAMLPEPLSSLAVQQGARVILDDTKHPEFSYSTITFRKSVIDQHPEAVGDFLTALEEAVNLINADPEKYSSLLSDLKLVPPPLAGAFKTPTFVTAGVPTQDQWADVIAWAIDKGLLEQEVAYASSVNDQFLP